MPMVIQVKNIATLDVSCLNEKTISPRQHKMPRIGNKGTKGTLKGLFRLGSVFLNTITDIQIAINAVNVP